MVSLEQVYLPIKKELKKVDDLLESSLTNNGFTSVTKVNSYLLHAKGKRLRPAMAILSARASQNRNIRIDKSMYSLAAAVELVHIASLIHDDVIDHAPLRHNRPSINAKYGDDVSITVGDYLYSKAFELISNCDNTEILSCVSLATRQMCEGQLLQVCERENLDILKSLYITMVQKKTAALFVASCKAGAILAEAKPSVKQALGEFGENLGIAFQIIDDCMDLVASKKELGKEPGADLEMGELTLPMLHLLSVSKDKNKILSLLRKQNNNGSLSHLRLAFLNSKALEKTKSDIDTYVQKSRNSLNRLKDTPFKQSLMDLTCFLLSRLTV